MCLTGRVSSVQGGGCQILICNAISVDLVQDGDKEIFTKMYGVRIRKNGDCD